MAVEHIFRCDGPDCERHQITRYDFPAQMLAVTERGDHGAKTDLYFCGWDCLLRFASRIEPEEIAA